VSIGLLLSSPAFALDQGATDNMSDQQISRIAGMLGSSNQEMRSAALGKLKEYGQAAMPGLIRIREAGSTAQRRGAVIGLAFMPIPQLTIDGLISALGDSNAVVRSFAAHALAKIGAPAASQVAELLTSPNDMVRIGAAMALTRMHKDAVSALSKVLTTENGLAKAKAAWLLGRIGPEARAAVPALVRALKDDDMRIMHVVAEAIDLIGADQALLYHEMILLGAKPGGFPLRPLGADCAPTLSALLSRPGTPVGLAAMYTLAHIGKEAEPALLEALKTGSPSQRTAAALLLTDIDPAIVHILPNELRESLAGARRKE